MKTTMRLSILIAAIVLAVAVGPALASPATGPTPLRAGQSTLSYCAAPGADFDGLSPLISTITVPDNGVVTDVTIYASIAHANLAEVELSVVHDAAGTMLILDRCSGDADLSATFADGAGGFDCGARIGGTFAPPDGSLAVFNNTASQGTWNFVAHDVSENGVSGTLNQWCINLTYTPGAVPPPADDGSGGTAATSSRWVPGDDRINPHPAAEVALYCRETGIHAYDRNGQLFFFASYAAIDAAAPSEDVPVASSSDGLTTLYNLPNGLIAVQRVQDRGSYTEYYQFFWDACPPTYKLTQVYHESGELLFYETWTRD